MKPVTFIAEIGKACNGDIAYCKEILQACKKAGVHGVRFHHFSLDESVYPEVLKKPSERAWSFKLQLPFLNERLFSADEYGTILEWCQNLGLDFIATPWDLTSFEFFSRLGATSFKINSINAMNIPLIKEILKVAEMTFLSTGGLSQNEVKDLVAHLELDRYQAALLHAVLAYPAPANTLNLRAIEILREIHPRVGYSSNDLMETSTVMACALGSTVIDKHVHLEGTGREIHKASIPVHKFAKEIQNVQEMKLLTERRIKQESRGEMVNQDLLSKSLVLKEDVTCDDVLSADNLTMQLPGKGIAAKSWFSVLGKKANSDLKKGAYLYSSDIKGLVTEKRNVRNFPDIPGKRGVVVRLKDIDEMISGRDVDFVEVHYAAGDLKQEDVCKEYDLDLVVHLPEYADGKLLDLCSHDKSLREFSIDVINKVMQKARKLQPCFKRSEGPLKFIVHPGALTYLVPDPCPEEQAGLFLDSLKRMDASGLEVLIENMTPFAWFLEDDWSPKQGMTNSFLDPEEIARFCKEYGYSMCLDVCHAKLYCNHAGKDLYTFMKTVKPYVKHLHFSDCTGIDGEGLQVGDGEINWQEICEVFEDYEHGWTPEIWHGHLDHGEKFYEAHERLSNEFQKHFLKQAANCTR